MKRMYSPGYHHNGFEALHTLQCNTSKSSHCGDNREDTLFS